MYGAQHKYAPEKAEKHRNLILLWLMGVDVPDIKLADIFDLLSHGNLTARQKEKVYCQILGF